MPARLALPLEARQLALADGDHGADLVDLVRYARLDIHAFPGGLDLELVQPPTMGRDQLDQVLLLLIFGQGERRAVADMRGRLLEIVELQPVSQQPVADLVAACGPAD